MLACRGMPEDFNKGEFALKPAHVREVAGLIYICLAESPPEFAGAQQILSGLAKLIDSNELERLNLSAR